jgi:hypothetical protein
MKKVVYLMFFALFCSSAFAIPKKDTSPRGKLFLGFGGTLFDAQNLNSGLKSSGLPEVHNEYFQFGGAYSFIQNRVITELEYYQTLNRSQSLSDFSSSLSLLNTFINFGYVLLDTKVVQLYPVAGLGYGRIGLSIIEEGEYSFYNFLSTPNNVRVIERNLFVGNAGLGLDFIFRNEDEEKKRIGVVFGIRGGVTYTISAGNWKATDIEFTDGPDMGLNGFYLRVVLGIWE